MQNALRGLRDTLPKPGQQRQNNTLNSLMQRYGTGGADDGMQWTQPQNRLASIGSQRAVPMQGGMRLDGGADAVSDAQANQAAQDASVVNAENAAEVGGLAMGLGQGQLSGLASLGTQAAVGALTDVAGPYGVSGMGKAGLSPQPGTQAFSQATPAMDTAPGVRDAGAVAAASSNNPGFVSSAMGAFPENTPAPNMMGGVPGFTDAAGSFMDATGIGDMFAAENQDVFGGVAGNVGSGNMGGGRGDPSRGANSGVGGGRGAGGGIGGGVGDVGADNPGGTGVL